MNDTVPSSQRDEAFHSIKVVPENKVRVLLFSSASIVIRKTQVGAPSTSASTCAWIALASTGSMESCTPL